PKGVEIVSARLQTPGRRWILIRVECHLSDAVGYKVLEATVTLAQVQIIGIRLVVVFMARALQRIEAFSLRNIQRPQDQPIYHAEHNRVGADGHRQRQNRADRKGWRLAQLPQRIAEILSKPTHPTTSFSNKKDPKACWRRMQFSYHSAQNCKPWTAKGCRSKIRVGECSLVKGRVQKRTEVNDGFPA